MRYKICNLVFDSNIVLPELPDAANDLPSFIVRTLPAQDSAIAVLDWFHHWRFADRRIWLSFGRHQASYVLRFPGIADFFLPYAGTEICCSPRPSVPLHTIRHLLIDQVLPLFLSYRGHIVVHASAILGSEGAAIFLGVSGQGKSTLAISFAADGLPLLTDDYLLLEAKENKLLVTPSYPGARLWEDTLHTLFADQPCIVDVAHYTDKKRLVPGHDSLPISLCPVTLSRVYCLAPIDESLDESSVSIERLSAREAFMTLVKATFKLDITNSDALVKEFFKLQQIATCPMFYRLSFPHDFSQLPVVREAILHHLQSE